MTRFIAALLITAHIASPASGVIAPGDLDPTPSAAATCAPVTVLETRGDRARVMMGEAFGWVQRAEIDAARCTAVPGPTLDASFRPREASTTAFA